TASASPWGRGTEEAALSASRARRSGAPGDLLHLGVLLHPPATALATDPALLEPAERAVEHVDAVVDPHHARTDALRQRDRARGVARVDRTAEAVGRVVPDAPGLVLFLEGDHRDARTEDLLACDPGIVAHVAEDGRLEEVAAPHVLRTSAARGEGRALGRSRGDVLLDLLPPLVADHGAERGGGVGRCAVTPQY